MTDDEMELLKQQRDAYAQASREIAAALEEKTAEAERLRKDRDAWKRSAEMACTEPEDDCACDGCRLAAERERGADFSFNDAGWI